MIIKISDLEDFLNELIEYNVEKQKEYDDKLNDLIGRLESDNEEWVQSFILLIIKNLDWIYLTHYQGSNII